MDLLVSMVLELEKDVKLNFVVNVGLIESHLKLMAVVEFGFIFYKFYK
jgi:hypothetical protein